MVWGGFWWDFGGVLVMIEKDFTGEKNCHFRGDKIMNIFQAILPWKKRKQSEPPAWKSALGFGSPGPKYQHLREERSDEQHEFAGRHDGIVTPVIQGCV